MFLLSNEPGGPSPLSVFWVRSVYGVSMKGYSGSVETGTSGLELMIALDSDKNVTRVLCVNFVVDSVINS